MDTKLFQDKFSENQLFLFNEEREIRIDIKREDLLHPEVSGNKLRKLQYNLKEAQSLRHDTILTYGGAFSNHIAATAAAGNISGYKTIGIIRGEELGLDIEKTLKLNRTLATAQVHGMHLYFVTRNDYRLKETSSFKDRLKKRFGRFYDIPEGGTNDLAVKGTMEILTNRDKKQYDIIAVAAGTGGTAAGIIKSAAVNQKVFVYGALRGEFLKEEIAKYSLSTDFEFYDDKRFGGYAKSDNELIEYMNSRFRESGIPLDPIYTSKLLYGIEQMIENRVIKGKTRILAIHTGGLQSIAGYNQKLAQKGRPIISYADHI